MHSIFRIAAAAALLGFVGCHKSKEKCVSVDKEPSSDSDLLWQDSLAAMSDNAAMYDLTLYDIHFVPHTTELNSLGTERLDQLSRLLSAYGGTVRYQTSSLDSANTETRLQHVRDYLAATGRDVSKVQVAAGPSAGRSSRADEALAAKARAAESAAESSSSSESSSMGSTLQSAGG